MQSLEPRFKMKVEYAVGILALSSHLWLFYLLLFVYGDIESIIIKMMNQQEKAKD